jgi:molecular chaperone GrpE
MNYQKQSSACNLIISQEQRQQTIDQVRFLLKERISLQQSLANQEAKNTADNEQLFLEFLEIFDALESLINYFETIPELSERAIKRLPKSLDTIQSKLLATLARKQVKKIEITSIESDLDLYQVVETQINPEVQIPKITKVIRQGFKIGEQLLRPVEVIIDQPPTNQSN